MAFGDQFSDCPVCGARHDPLGPHVRFQPELVPFPKKKQVMRLITKTNHAFDFIVPDDFSMAILMSSIRGAGYMMNELCYFPIDNIGMIFLYEASKPPGGDQSNVVQFPELVR